VCEIFFAKNRDLEEIVRADNRTLLRRRKVPGRAGLCRATDEQGERTGDDDTAVLH
jgi:hypothetical protein